ncbi:MAG: hypothetical protein AAGE43_07500 [Pseudomonadota bacterium]
MSAAIALLLAMPLTVYVLAGIFLLKDNGADSRSFRALTFRALLLALLIYLTPAEDRAWIALGAGIVVLLHLGAQYGLRYLISSGRWPAERNE